MAGGDPTSIAEIQQKHLDTYQGNVDRIESDAGTERQDKAGYEGRFVFELLQNAVDEMEATDDPRVAIELTDEALIVANNGAEFSYDDLYALTLTTRTTKAGKRTIGHKGRGFTSVLNITDEPRVFSETISGAKFDREATCRRLNGDEEIRANLDGPLSPGDVPMLQLPFPAEQSRTVRRYLDSGYTTVFEFPLQSSNDRRGSIERKLQQLRPNTVALLPELQQIEIDTGDWTRTWNLERTTLDAAGHPTLIELDTETTPVDEAIEPSPYLLFERDTIDRGWIAEQAALDDAEIDAMGQLSVGIAFQASHADEGSDSAGAEWALDPVPGIAEGHPPNVHVFLPTNEHSPIPALVTGTFQSDTSRRNLPLEHDAEQGYQDDFNSLLFDEVATLLGESVVPFVEDSATSTRRFLDALDPSLGGRRDPSFTTGTVDHCLFEAIREGLRDVPFLPSNDTASRLSISDLLLPCTSSEVSGLGEKFADIVGPRQLEAEGKTGRLPAMSLLSHRTVTTLRTLGGAGIPPERIPRLIEGVPTETIQFDTHRTAVPTGDVPDEEAEENILWCDPVLVLLTEIRKTLDSDEKRSSFDTACRTAAVFPTAVETHPSGGHATERRSSSDTTFFIPPEASVGDDTLPDLVFLPRELYHGTDPEAAEELRQTALPDEFETSVETIWNTADFGFDRIYDVAIRPRIPGPNSLDADSEPIESRSTLGAIQAMADVTSPENDRSPAEPLLYKSSRRSFFDLCRLPIPAKRLEDDEIRWIPAHRVYFGEVWQARLGRDEARLVEPLLQRVGDQESVDQSGFEPWILASPQWFEIDDEDQLEAWTAFFRWLGVAEHVRPLPLFAPDAATRHRYRKTEGLERPPRSAISARDSLRATDDSDTPVDHRYRGLSEAEWADYRDHLLERVEPLVPEEDHRYLFQVNPLEYCTELLSAARGDRKIGARLLRHLSAWWDDGLDRHRNAIVAEFTNQRWRSSSLSYVFSSDERESLGTNLWLWQLRQESWVPNTFETDTKVRPSEAWILPESERRRFSLHSDLDYPLLPFLWTDPSTSGETLLGRTPGLFEELQFSTAVAQANFAPADARRALSRIADLVAGSPDDYSEHAVEIELLYSRLATLFPALEAQDIADDDWERAQEDLTGIDVLCSTAGTYEFQPASEVYFVRSQNARERYRGLGLPILALVKSEAPTFGTHLGAADMRDAVTLEPVRGDPLDYPLNIEGVTVDADWLKQTLAGLLVRLRVDRAVDADERGTINFYRYLRPVDGLEISFDGDVIDESAVPDQPTPYHITEDDREREIIIDGTLTGDEFVDALARAYTEYLDVPHYEAAYNLIDRAFGSPTPVQALADRLDRVSGGQSLERIEATEQRLFGDGEPPQMGEGDEGRGENDGFTGDDGPDSGTTRSPGGDDGGSSDTRSGARSERVPSPESLTRIGDREIHDSGSKGNSGSSSRGTGSGSSGESGGGPVPPSQEYRTKIDAFGMEVTMSAERDRLADLGVENPDELIIDVHTPEKYQDARDENEHLEDVIQNSIYGDALDTDWPGFDVLTLRIDEDGSPRIDRCIELKTSGRKTRKPSLSWNEWKAASERLTEHYYLYVVRNVRNGKSGEASLLEIPRPFQTLTAHERETQERNVQLDLRSFDLEDENIIRQPIEWDED